MSDTPPRKLQVPAAVASTEDALYSQWKAWDASPFGALSALDRTYYDAELAFAPRGRPLAVLEVGFGHGAFMAYARQVRGWQVTGFDINAVETRAAREAGYRAVESFDLLDADERFDLIVAFDVIEHLDAEQLRQVLAQWRARLAPEGAVLVRFPNGDSPFGLSNQNGDDTHRSVITRSKMVQLALQAGLRVRQYRGERRPILCGNTRFMLQRLVAAPIRWFVDVVANAIFLPTKRVPFSSQNAVAVLGAARPGDAPPRPGRL